LVKQGFTKFI